VVDGKGCCGWIEGVLRDIERKVDASVYMM
jgi:hypothetical protein